MPLLAPVFVVMGVAGAGKSTLATELAAHYGIAFIEGDLHHPPANIAKIAAGQALTDNDRWPWLAALREAASQKAMDEGAAVLACSALKQAYRQFFQEQTQCQWVFFYLHLDKSELIRRLTARKAHFAGVSILESQLATLERTEELITLDASVSTDQIIEQARPHCDPFFGVN